MWYLNWHVTTKNNLTESMLFSYLIYFNFNEWNIQHDYFMLYISFGKNEIYQIGHCNQQICFALRILHGKKYKFSLQTFMYMLILFNPYLNPIKHSCKAIFRIALYLPWKFDGYFIRFLLGFSRCSIKMAA